MWRGIMEYLCRSITAGVCGNVDAQLYGARPVICMLRSCSSSAADRVIRRATARRQWRFLLGLEKTYQSEHSDIPRGRHSRLISLSVNNFTEKIVSSHWRKFDSDKCLTTETNQLHEQQVLL